MMRQIKIGDMVWCKSNSSQKNDKYFVGTVQSIKDEKYFVSHDETTLVYSMELVDYEQITPLRFKPLNKETELKSGWVTNLFYGSTGSDQIRFGWIYENEENINANSAAYPVKYWIDGNGVLKIEKLMEGDGAFCKAISVVNEIFNYNPNSNVVAQCTSSERILSVRLFEKCEKLKPTPIVMNETMKISMIAVNKLMYFGWNYEMVTYENISLPRFLVEAKWTCSISHMISKWDEVTRKKNAFAYLLTFYASLDTENRKALIEWVMLNYNGEIKII